MAKVIFGFGGTKLICGGIIASFPLCKGYVKYIDENMSKTARSGKLIELHKGWRPVVTIQINNASDSQADEWKNLIRIINFSKINNEPISVSPRYNESLSYGLTISCKLMSDFDPQDIGEIAAAQYIELVFQGVNRVYTIPTLTSDTAVFNVVTGDGDNLITGYGTSDNLI